MASAALGSPSVRAAAASRHWKELYVCAPLGARQLEGYIDLLYRGPDGLVVVDYKTAATSDPAELSKMWILRKLLHPIDELAAIEFLLDKMKDTKTNTDFFDAMKR